MLKKFSCCLIHCTAHTKRGQWSQRSVVARNAPSGGSCGVVSGAMFKQTDSWKVSAKRVPTKQRVNPPAEPAISHRHDGSVLDSMKIKLFSLIGNNAREVLCFDSLLEKNFPPQLVEPSPAPRSDGRCPSSWGGSELIRKTRRSRAAFINRNLLCNRSSLTAAFSTKKRVDRQPDGGSRE